MNREYAYHFTNPVNVDSILCDGLRMVNKIDISLARGMSGWLKFEYKRFYGGKWPIFLALPNCGIDYLFRGEQTIILRVDVTGLKKFPDLPTFETEFLDQGSSNASYAAFKNIRAAGKIIAKDGERVIEETKTFAVISHIAPWRISK